MIGEELRQTNELCKQFETIGNYLDVLPLGNSAAAVEYRNLNATINLNTLDFDIYCVTSDIQSGNRNLTVTLKGEGGTSKVDGADRITEPLSYPILFDNGMPQYGPELRSTLTFGQYIACRMLKPEIAPYENDSSIYLGHESTRTFHDSDDPDVRIGRFFPSNRFRIFYKLGMTYLVDMMSRAQDYSLKYISLHQSKIMGGDFHEPEARINEQHEDDDTDNPVIKKGIFCV
jgi:hypothetical protein